MNNTTMSESKPPLRNHAVIAAILASLVAGCNAEACSRIVHTPDDGQFVVVERTRDLQIIAAPLPGSVAKPPRLHFSVLDASGDSAIIQFIEGKRVMTMASNIR